MKTLILMAGLCVASVSAIYSYKQAQFWEGEAKRLTNHQVERLVITPSPIAAVEEIARQLDDIESEIDKNRRATGECMAELRDANRMLLEHARR